MFRIWSRVSSVVCKTLEENSPSEHPRVVHCSIVRRLVSDTVVPISSNYAHQGQQVPLLSGVSDGSRPSNATIARNFLPDEKRMAHC